MLQLPSIFSRHMVLQRGRANAIWGSDAPGQLVTLAVDGADVPMAQARAAADGRFLLRCPELPAGGPYALRIQGSQLLVLDDVLVGEVWLASGQSNMEFPLNRAEGAPQALAQADRPRLRLLHIPNRASHEPQADVQAEWRVCDASSASGFSAVAYFFGVDILETQGVPVGLIGASWGGTMVEPWTSAEALAPLMDLDAATAPFRIVPDELEQLRLAHGQAALEWEREALPADPGNAAYGLGWSAPAYDDSGWPTMPLPALWQSHGLRHNGVVWFRRSLTIPPAWRGQDLTLSLGVIDDFDHTYVNDVEVGAHPKGTPEAYQIARRYTVPALLTHSGRVTVAVRVFDHFGEGGFHGPTSDMWIAPSAAPGERLTLAGDWRYQVEHEIPLVPTSVFATYPDMPAPLRQQDCPAALFNGMIAPLVPFGMRGALWYQGESNTGSHATYREHLTAMIRDWRARWDDVFPFLLVQLAGYRGGAGWPELREAQRQTLAEPETGMAVALDIGDADDIHPLNKREVGRRLALQARAKVYGENIVCDGPTAQGGLASGALATVRFASAQGLATSDGAAPQGFELAGADGVFAPAQASIAGDAVELRSAAVAAPVAARYAWADICTGNLINGAGLPASPFSLSLTR